VNEVMKMLVPQNAGPTLTNYKTVSFSRTVLYVVSRKVSGCMLTINDSVEH